MQKPIHQISFPWLFKSDGSHVLRHIGNFRPGSVFGWDSLLCLAEKAMEQLTLQPIKRIEGHVQLPGSKSLSNRVLLLAALSEGTTLVKNLLVRRLLLAANT